MKNKTDDMKLKSVCMNYRGLVYTCLFYKAIYWIIIFTLSNIEEWYIFYKPYTG